MLFESAREAHDSGKAARRSDPGAGLAALAVPVRHRGAVVAALAVAGPPAGPRPVEPDLLAVAADCAALALAARPAAGMLTGAAERDDSGLALAEELATIASASTVDGVLSAALDVAATRFGARGGFACLPAGPGGVEVVGWRGLDRERLGTASRHPGFTRLISRPDVTVVPPTDPAVAQLTAGAEFAISLPLHPVLADGEPTALVLLVPVEPDAAGRRSLEALRQQVAAGLRAARSAAAVESGGAQLATLIHSLTEPALAVDSAG
ncbi:MAG: hypothetical protein LC792_13805, partial [Actinobacteria bacterium]|nr:hypothetical protein [Actinomycetota bacterium]